MESFKKLKYLHYFQMFNPRTMIKIQAETRQSDDDPTVFKRIFVLFDAIRKCFLEACRPLIRVDGCDGCDLKSPYGGTFLSAIVIDGNRRINIAFGICNCRG